LKIAGVAQLVERNLAKVDVAGSSPVSRSVPSSFLETGFYLAPYPSGKGEVCKTFMHQFESDRRLEKLYEKPYLKKKAFFISISFSFQKPLLKISSKNVLLFCFYSKYAKAVTLIPKRESSKG
jgi:hypothetical protein